MKGISVERAEALFAETMGAVCGLCRHREQDGYCGRCKAMESIRGILEEAQEEEPTEALLLALKDFEEQRKKLKKPMTDRAKELLLRKLDRLAADVETKIEILHQSTINGWTDVYPLKEKRTERFSNLQHLYEEVADG